MFLLVPAYPGCPGSKAVKRSLLSSEKPGEEKEGFWNEVFHLVSCVPHNEMVVFAGDMNGHIGSSNVGYDGTHGGFGYGSRNADGSRILEFADGLNLVICNTLFMKQEAGESTVDYIMVRWRIKLRFVTSGLFQVRNVCQSINC